MTIKTELGKGTTISISLPVRQQATRLEIPLSDEDTVEPMTILLVDDEPVVPEVMAALPTSEGHKVIQAKSGHEGLEAFQRETHDIVPSITPVVVMSASLLVNLPASESIGAIGLPIERAKLRGNTCEGWV